MPTKKRKKGKVKISASRKQKTTDYVVVDHPKENETIGHPYYTIRIGTSGNGNVQVSIDGGDWNHCRHSEGFWWFDWANYPLGSHKIIARICDYNGKLIKKSKLRKCIFK